MKTNIQKILIIFVSLLLWNCTEDFLDRTELGRDNDVTFYTNEEAAKQAVIACYDNLTFFMAVGRWGISSWIPYVLLGNSRSDDSEVYTSVAGWDPDRDKVGDFDIFPDNKFAINSWKGLYKQVRICNIVTEKVPHIEFETAEEPAGYNLKERLIAEAKVIRAFTYFYLVNVFGDVPLITKSLSPSEYQMPRTDKEEIWQFIETDLRESIPHLPLRSEYPAADLGRITKGTAQTLLMKALIFQAGDDESNPKWQDAFQLAKEIINSNEYALLSNFHNLWKKEYDLCEEFIFEIVCHNSIDGESSQYAKYHGIRWHYTTDGDYIEWWGYGNDAPTQNLIDAFEKGTDWEDPRISSTIWRPGDTIINNNDEIDIIDSVDTKTGYQFKKYTPDMYDLPSTSAAPKNVVMFRYADVLLCAAEAAWYSGNEAEARKYVNMIRERARTDEWGIYHSQALPDISSSGEQLLKDIWHERRVELAGECHRFYDLVRQDRVGEVMRALGKDFVDGKHELMPVPSSEISLNPNLTQNNGY